MCILAVVLADLEHIVSAQPPTRSPLALFVLRGAGVVSVIVVAAGLVGVLNLLLPAHSVFGSRTAASNAGGVIYELAGVLVAAAAAWAVASASADDVGVA
jgi:hypothetical protein